MNKDVTSQVGYVIFINIDIISIMLAILSLTAAGKDNMANLIDSDNNNSRRVVRSVLGAEIFGLADVCDSAIVIKHELKVELGKTLKIQVLTDSEI